MCASSRRTPPSTTPPRPSRMRAASCACLRFAPRPRLRIHMRTPHLPPLPQMLEHRREVAAVGEVGCLERIFGKVIKFFVHRLDASIPDVFPRLGTNAFAFRDLAAMPVVVLVKP